MTPETPDENNPDRPPFFQSWRSWYWLVLVNLVVQVIVFYMITQYYK